MNRSGINAAMLSRILKDVFFVWIVLSCSIASFGQCSITISTFPYNQDFEAGQSGWNSGGVNDDWAYGNPSKPVITGAASGTKCWITGGLTNSFYNYGERSWVQSPCFNFSSLSKPYITFKIFWDTEYQFDGGNLQYSLNGGSSWINVGAFNDPVNCLSANWFNHSSINYLNTLTTARHGWTGSGSANGSNGWVLAKHCMAYLAGEPQVIFRFAFGAGTQSNDFDGLAFDDITISEAPPIVPAFSFSCAGSNIIRFTDQSTTCPNNWIWNFNDPGSGISNTSVLQNPVHTFSTTGSFHVTLTALNGCSNSAVTSNVVFVMNATASPTDATCFGGNDGSATIQVTGPGSPFSYHWFTNPVQTNVTATGLAHGTYLYIASGSNVCSDTNIVTISQPTQINHSLATVPAHCGFDNGVASLAVNGGTPGYSYNWSMGGGNASSVINLAAGNYSVIITDAANCQVTDNFVIVQPPPLATAPQTRTATCGLLNGSISLNPTGGTLPYGYSWFPVVSGSQSATNLSGGNYFVTITDFYGCIHRDTISVQQQPEVTVFAYANPDTCTRSVGTGTVHVMTGTPPFVYSWSQGGFVSPYVNTLKRGFYTIAVTDVNGCTNSQTIHVGDYGSFEFDLGDDATICTGNEMELSAGNYSAYEWQDHSQQPTLIIHQKGKYWVTVTNQLGCSKTDTISITEECLDNVLLPNAFSPDGDGKNDFFFASGINVTSFSMKIFNRWGEAIFAGDDIHARWDGTFKNKALAPDVFAWRINFSINDKPMVEKFGNVLLIR